MILQKKLLETFCSKQNVLIFRVENHASKVFSHELNLTEPPQTNQWLDNFNSLQPNKSFHLINIFNSNGSWEKNPLDNSHCRFAVLEKISQKEKEMILRAQHKQSLLQWSQLINKVAPCSPRHRAFVSLLLSARQAHFFWILFSSRNTSPMNDASGYFAHPTCGQLSGHSESAFVGRDWSKRRRQGCKKQQFANNWDFNI